MIFYSKIYSWTKKWAGEYVRYLLSFCNLFKVKKKINKMLCTCNCMFVCFLSDLLIVSLKKNEKVGQLFCVCVFLFFPALHPPY